MPKKFPIIIVDDDPDDRQNLIASLSEVGCCNNPLLQFENGLQLLEYLKKASDFEIPLLIFLDLNMPVIDGRQILKELKSNKLLRHIPIIVLTTTKSELERTYSYELGANLHLFKPDTYQQAIEIAKAVTLLWGLDVDKLIGKSSNDFHRSSKEIFPTKNTD